MFATGMLRAPGFAREVNAEWLDTLAPDDPRARRSRADLRRLNRIMGMLGSARRALDPLLRGRASMHLVELGAGDGSLMARLAHHCASVWPDLHVTLLDAQPVVSPATRAEIENRGWHVDVVRSDVFTWLRDAPRHAHEIVFANLFVHHFDGLRLAALLAGIAARADAFACCEPRRSRLALLGSRCLGALGCNDVTRHDAVASVQAGFRAQELGDAWPRHHRWNVREGSVGAFGHRFVAQREGTDR